MKTASHITRFKLVGDAEAISFLVLLCIAMPMKYVFQNPMPVKYVGMAHGVLFCLYVLVILECGIKEKWDFKKYVLALLFSFIPFGTFIFNKKIL